MYTQTFDLKGSVLRAKALEQITTRAMEANTQFLGMGFQNGTMILSWASRPIQYTQIRKEIRCVI